MFERLVDKAARQAAKHRLREQGVMRGSIVAWLAWNRWEMLAVLAACRQLGAVLLPLNGRLANAELTRIVEHAGAGCLLHDEAMADAALQLRSTAQWHPGPADGVLEGDVLLVYTSGTTGQPKGAMHTAVSMTANVEAAIAAQGLHERTRALAVLPLFHLGGLAIQTLPTLCAGGQVRLHPRFDADTWFDELGAWRPTTTLLVPAVMRALIEHPRWPTADLSSLQFVVAGSQIVPRHLIEAFHTRGVPVAQVYGATETGPLSIVLKPHEARQHVGSVGRAALGVEVQLAVDGEILLRAPNLMRAYHRHVEPAFDAKGWFHTGDLAVQRPGGWFEVVGRTRELIISGGENIYPAEVENLVSAWPGVADCAVVGLPDERWGEVPVLAVVAAPGVDLDKDALLRMLACCLARFKLPRRIVTLTALPRTALGKVQKTELARALAARDQAEGHPPT